MSNLSLFQKYKIDLKKLVVTLWSVEVYKMLRSPGTLSTMFFKLVASRERYTFAFKLKVCYVSSK